MKNIIPNLFIEHCMENLQYYKGIFGDELKNFVPRHDSPEKVMHAELHINENCVLFFGDKLQEAIPDPNRHIFLMLETEAEIENLCCAPGVLCIDNVKVIALKNSNAQVLIY
jgi:PhnB protein